MKPFLTLTPPSFLIASLLLLSTQDILACSSLLESTPKNLVIFREKYLQH